MEGKSQQASAAASGMSVRTARTAWDAGTSPSSGETIGGSRHRDEEDQGWAVEDFDEPARLSHISKMVLSIVKSGGPFWTRTRDLSLIRTAL